MSEHSVEQNLQSPDAQAQRHEHISRYLEVGLGNLAVSFHNTDVKYPWAIQYDPSDGKAVSIVVVDQLAQTRARLAGLSEVEKQRANTGFAANEPPAWLRDAVAPKIPLKDDRDYVLGMIRKDRYGNNIVANRTMLNFLEWHNFKLAGDQAELDSNEQNHKQEFARRYSEAIDKGWIPESARGNLERLQGTALIQDDGFLTSHIGIRGSARRFASHKHQVRIGPSEATTPETLTHEFLHVVTGADPEGETADGPQPDKDTGRNGIFGQGVGGRAVNEAVVEHLADAMVHGKIDEVDPAARIRKNAVYRQERILLQTLMRDGKYKINIRSFVAALLENGDQAVERGKSSARYVLRKQLKRAFPFTDVIQELQSLQVGQDETQGSVSYDYAVGLKHRSDEYRKIPKTIARMAFGIDRVPGIKT